MKFFDLSPNAELRYSINTKGADLSLPHCRYKNSSVGDFDLM